MRSRPTRSPARPTWATSSACEQGLGRLLLIDRAVFKELIGPFCVALAAFYGVLILGISGFELVRQAVALGLPGSLVLQSLVWRSPEALGYALPVSCLAASLAAYARLASQGEAVAWRALGLGPWRLARPAVAFGLGVFASALVCFASAPEGAYLARSAWSQARPNLEGVGEALALSEREGGVLRRLAIVTPAQGGLRDVLVAELEGGKVVRLTQAVRAERHAGSWRFLEGWRAELQGDGVQATAHFDSLTQALPPAASLLEASGRRPEELGFDAAWQRLEALRASGLWGPQERGQAVVLHQRLAVPAAALAFALGGVAAGLAGARPGLGRGLGATALAVFGFYLAMFASSSAGAAGWIGPALAAWAPSGLALLVAAWGVGRGGPA